MKTLNLIAVIALSFSQSMKLQAQAADVPLAEKKIKFSVTREVEMQYLHYVPKDYDAQSGKKWPLLLFLHGAGERGTNLQRVAVHGPPMLAKQGKEFPFIIIAPQCPEGERWQTDALLGLLERVTKEYAVDTNRVYLTGLSMGGYGTWSLGVARPGMFAAIAPICGGGQPVDILLAGYGRNGNPVAALPVWAFHGAKDKVVPLEESERMVNAFKRSGAKDVKLTVYPEADHNSWTETYNNPELYDWLLAHSLKDRSAQ